MSSHFMLQMFLFWAKKKSLKQTISIKAVVMESGRGLLFAMLAMGSRVGVNVRLLAVLYFVGTLVYMSLYFKRFMLTRCTRKRFIG